MDERIKTKVRRLLSLAKSDNVNEAANAAAAAQALIDQHHIDLAMLDAPMQEEEIVNDARRFECFRTKKRCVAWKWSLLWSIAGINDCQPWSQTVYVDGAMSRVFYVIGRPTDALQVVSLFTFVVAQIEYLSTHCEGKGRGYRNSFRHGAGTEVEDRLEQAHHDLHAKLEETAKAERKALTGQADLFAAASKKTALVRAETAVARLAERGKKVEAFMEYSGLKYRTTSTSVSVSDGAFESGRAAGRTVRTSGSAKAIGGAK